MNFSLHPLPPPQMLESFLKHWHFDQHARPQEKFAFVKPEISFRMELRTSVLLFIYFVAFEMQIGGYKWECKLIKKMFTITIQEVYVGRGGVWKWLPDWGLWWWNLYMWHSIRVSKLAFRSCYGWTTTQLSSQNHSNLSISLSSFYIFPVWPLVFYAFMKKKNDDQSQFFMTPCWCNF